MVINKRRKSSRQLGENTHGWGKNQHRGAGCRGGRGNAGQGKKAHCRETEVWHIKNHFGKHGFVNNANARPINTINLKDVEDKLPAWIAQKKASATEVNLKALGYTKLLSTGRVTKKLKITVPTAAARAAEKIKAAGGELVVNE